MLLEHGWITRSADSWQLTSKGEFEGGRYLNSERFGTYIGWPERIATHRIFVANPDARRWSAAALAYRIGLTPRLSSLLLRELGWVAPGLRGWILTDRGRELGGSEEGGPDHRGATGFLATGNTRGTRSAPAPGTPDYR